MSCASRWLHSYTLMVRWQALSFRSILPIALIAQIFAGVGTVLGLPYLMPEIDSRSAMFLVTGAPTLSLIMLGMVMVPQWVAQAKAKGTFDYMQSLPVPRMTYLLADLTIWMVATVPGVIISLIVGSLRFGFALEVSPLAVPAFMLVMLTATSIGYAIAHLSPKPELVNVLTNFMIFCLFLLSPVNFPIDRLPPFIGALHRFLPVKYAADVVRGTLTTGFTDGLALGFMVLAVWCVGAFGTTYALVSRRR